MPTSIQRPARRAWIFTSRESLITVPRSAPIGRTSALKPGGAVVPPLASLSVGSSASPLIDVKDAQVSKSPSRARSVAPSVTVRPREPTTSAVTIRGETPRLVTLMPLNLPFTSPPSFFDALAIVGFDVQRWRGETLSNSSSTDTSHGRGSRPSDVFSTDSVLPPLVEKK